MTSVCLALDRSSELRNGQQKLRRALIYNSTSLACALFGGGNGSDNNDDVAKNRLFLLAATTIVVVVAQPRPLAVEYQSFDQSKRRPTSRRHLIAGCREYVARARVHLLHDADVAYAASEIERHANPRRARAPKKFVV